MTVLAACRTRPMSRSLVRALAWLLITAAFLAASPAFAQAQLLPGMLKPGAAPASKPGAEKGTEAQKVDLPEQLEQKLAEARAELARIEAPDGAAAGAPAGTPERDLVRRRVLWQQLARTYQRHLDELANLEVARKRRAELEQRIAAWQGFPEKPPYPILKADDLRKQLQTASLKLDGFQAKRQMLDKQIDGARDFLKNAEEEVRQAREKLERAKSQAESLQAAWQLDLARLTSRVPAAAIASLEAGRRANQEQLAAARQEADFGERMLKEVEGKTSFSESDLDTIRARVEARRKVLRSELEQALSVETAAHDTAADAAVKLERQQAEVAQTAAELERAKRAEAEAAVPAPAGAAGDAGGRGAGTETAAPPGKPEAVEPPAAAAAPAAEAPASARSTLEKELAERTGRLRELEQQEELARVRAENTSIRIETLKSGLENLDIQYAFWEIRYAFISRGAENAGAVRDAFRGGRALLDRLAPVADLARRQVQLAMAVAGEQEGRLISAATPEARKRVEEFITAYRDRAGLYVRSLADVEEVRDLIRRWMEEFDVSIREQGAVAKVESWRDDAFQTAKAIWTFEIFTAEDTIEVDGQKITGKRGVTVGKVVTAVLILVIGLWLSGRVARLAERFVVKRFAVEPNLARITRRWVLAFTFIVLVVFSLVSVKIPLTVFAFLGGAVAIGVGFGMQNLLKNLMSGLMLLSERPFRPGDIVEVGGVRGTVTDINVRSSTIRDGNGIETLVPNSTFIEQNVTNWTYTSRRVRQTIKVGVAYGSPTREVSDLLLQAVDRHGLVLSDPKPQVQFEDFGADALMFGLYYWLELKPGVESPTVASDLRFMIEKTLTENGIAIAFPQRDVHLDAARPLPVRIVAGDGAKSEPAAG